MSGITKAMPFAMASIQKATFFRCLLAYPSPRELVSRNLTLFYAQQYEQISL